MTDSDPNKAYADARASLRDTAKWIVSILGATVVLVIGSGLIAKIADLDLTPRLIVASCLLALTLLCLIPLRSAIAIVATKLTPLAVMVHSLDFASARSIVNDWLHGQYPAPIDTIEKLYQVYATQTSIANDPTATVSHRAAAGKALAQLQPRIREVIEITNTEYLRIKFDRLLKTTMIVLPGIGVALFFFLIFSHRDDTRERALASLILLQIPWGADVEAALQKAGLDAKCYVKSPPQWLQISEMSGLRAGVLVVPHDLSSGCPAIRVIVTNGNKVYPAN